MAGVLVLGSDGRFYQGYHFEERGTQIVASHQQLVLLQAIGREELVSFCLY